MEKQYKNPNVGVGAIVYRGGDILMVKRRKIVHGGQTWSTPGGYLDFGEDPIQCAIRETFEETGIRVINPRFRAITNDIFPEEDKHFVTIWMEAEYQAGDMRIGSPEEIGEVGWYQLSSLPEPLFLSLRNLLNGKCYPVPKQY